MKKLSLSENWHFREKPCFLYSKPGFPDFSDAHLTWKKADIQEKGWKTFNFYMQNNDKNPKHNLQ